MGITVTTKRFATPTSQGEVTLTDTDLGGLTPKAVMIRTSNAVADATHRGNVKQGIGFAVGRVSGPKPLNLADLHDAVASSLKPSLELTITQRVRQEVDQYLPSALATAYTQVRDELTHQYRRDLKEVAIQMLEASSAVTHNLLAELIEALNAVQTEDRHRIVTALAQMDLQRQQESTDLRNNFDALAVGVTDELLRTKQDMATLFAYARTYKLVPDTSKSLEPSNERSVK